MKKRLEKIKSLAENVIHEAELVLAELEEQPDVPELAFRIIEIEPGLVRAEWDSGLATQYPDLDLQFYNAESAPPLPAHRPWQITVRTEVPSKNMKDGQHFIPVSNREGEWRFRLIAEGFESEVIPYIYTPEVEEPEPAPETGEQITIHYIPEAGDPLQLITGIVEDGDSVKVYVNQRNGRNLLEFESTDRDLRNWKLNGESPFPARSYLFRGSSGRLHGMRPDGRDVNLYLGSRLQNSLGRAYSWKVDGQIRMHEAPNGYFRGFGRVRGNTQPRDEGGWGGQLPPFPEGAFNDRRGISYHFGDDWGPGWRKNRILADPADYFEGYHSKDVDLVPDFYDSYFMPDGRGFVNIFWKSKSRKVDRRHLEPGISDARRYRLTGEFFPVPAIYSGGEITLFPDKTVIPRHLHERDPLASIPYTGPAGKKEIGEVNLNGVLLRDGYAYIFYKHRGGLHYEGHDMYPSGLYIYRMSIAEFDGLFG